MQSLEDLSKERLINDLVKLRERIDELEKIKEEKEKHEAELAQTKAMFEGLFEFAPDAIVVVDSKGGIVQANQQAERLFGYPRKELIGADHDTVLVPDRFRGKHLEDRRQYTSAPRVRQMGTGLDLYGRRKDGTEFPVDIALGPLQAKDEIVTLAVVRDITERKRAEMDLAAAKQIAEEKAEEAEESQRVLAAIMEYAPEGVAVTDVTGRITSISKVGIELTGMALEKLRDNSIEERHSQMGLYMADGLTPAIGDDIPIRKVMRTGETVKSRELVVKYRDGREIPILVSAGPIKDKRGNMRGTVHVWRDISELKRVEEDLETHRRQLEDMVRERTAELEMKTTSLQELNTALKVLLQQREEDKKATEERFVMNVRNLVLPYVEQMK